MQHVAGRGAGERRRGRGEEDSKRGRGEEDGRVREEEKKEGGWESERARIGE